MAENTPIQWADDSVGFWWGCKEKGPGCLNCYARDGYPVAVAESQMGLRLWDSNRVDGQRSFPSVRMKIEGAADTLRRLNRKAEKEGKPRVVFINSQADSFEETDARIVRRLLGRKADCDTNDVAAVRYQVAHRFEGLLKWVNPAASAGCGLPFWTLDDERREMFEVIDECLWLRCILLTKRPENAPRMTPCRRDTDGDGNCPLCFKGNFECKYRENVIIGTSVSTQADFNKNVPSLHQCRDLTPVLMVSAEPIIEWIDTQYPEGMYPKGPEYCCSGFECGCQGRPIEPPALYGIDWIVVGGESGPNARPCDIHWILSIVTSTAGTTTKCFVKQVGSNPTGRAPTLAGSADAPMTIDPDWLLKIKDSKGGNIEEWEPSLRVRQMPGVSV